MDVMNIDGSIGEGGGQVLRTSLTLAMLLKRELRIKNIRAKRPKPGLMRQHLACVKAAQRVSNALVEGDALGSLELRFVPNEIVSGHFEFDVGGAGSTTLVAQTVLLPLLLRAKEKSTLVLKGGTHNPLAPSLSFFEQSFLPLLYNSGADISLETESLGFMPAGGGCWQLNIAPSTMKPFSLLSRSALNRSRVVTLQTGVARTVAERAITQYKSTRLAVDEYQMTFATAKCPGFVMSHSYEFDNCLIMFEQLGRKQLSAERVAAYLAKQARNFIGSEQVLCEYLEDQLLLPLAFIGGGIAIGHESLHTKTNLALINSWLPERLSMNESSQTRSITAQLQPHFPS